MPALGQLMSHDPAISFLFEKISTDADTMAATIPALLAPLAVLSVAGQIAQHLHEGRDSIPNETQATLRLAATLLVHCSRLFPPTLNIDGSQLAPFSPED